MSVKASLQDKRSSFRKEQFRSIASLLFAVTTSFSFCPALCAPADSGDAPKRMHVIAHRGGRKWAPENTLSSFRKALELGVDGVELDIHRCKSGELIVIHDEDLPRTTNGDGFIADKTLEELKKLDAGSWYDKSFAGEKLPLLDEVLKLVQGKTEINIEIKNGYKTYPGIEDDLLKLLETYPYPDKIVISSFDHQCLLNIHKRTDKYRLALLIDGLLVDLPTYAKKIGVQNWHPGFSNIGFSSVKQAHDAGLVVNSWTVNTTDEWNQAKEMHLDGVITDDPVAAKKFFQH
jgi:glycerophosphoryl diester phosphodiesterase